MGARLPERWQLALPLAVPALAGLWYLHSFGAPPRLLAVNAGALGLAMVWILFGRVSHAPRVRLGLAAGLVLALFLPLLTGPDLGGVSRWLPAGPVALHSGALLLPLLVVLAAGHERWGPALLALATAALALQPDAQGLAALALACIPLAVTGRNRLYWPISAAAAVLAALTFHAGGLEPQRYTEGVLAHAAQRSPAVAGLLGLLLLAGPMGLVAAGVSAARAETSALGALFFAFAAMAMIGPFPFPLIGYGAAPILGFGLALGAVRRLPPAPASR